MMEAFFVRSLDDQGGHLDLYRAAPVMEHERRTIVEVRKGEFPPDLWLKIQFGELPPEPGNIHYDNIYKPHWDKADVWWTKEGGFTATHGS
jgi:hypothetical protein